MPTDLSALQLALHEASNSLAASLVERNEDAPHLLYHYTNTAGMRGILDSNVLWATHYRFLNDSSEVQHGESLLASLVEERIAKVPDGSVSNFLRYALRTMRVFDGMLDCYIACFCGRDDLLTQWRTYTPSGGGYALGFQTDLIRRRTVEFDDSQRFALRRVVYKPETQRDILIQIIDRVVEIAESGLRSLPPKFDTTTSFLAAAAHQSDGGSMTCIIPRIVFAEPV